MITKQSLFDNDYIGSRSGLWNRDVCDLAAPSGEPAAIPVSPGIKDLDTRYNYITGDKGFSMRLQSYNPSFNIDFIGAEQHAKLRRWKHNRTKLMVGQGIGRHTRLLYYPTHLQGMYFRGSLYNADDHLRAGNQLTAVQATDSLYWDHCAQLFRGGFSANNNCIVPTPGGAGLLASRDHTNRMKPSYPEGAGEGPGSGNSAWTRGGTDYADITFALNANGFGHNDCPHSLRVTTDGSTSSSRYIYMSAAWNSGHGSYQGYSFTGAGYASLTIWLRGKFPASAVLTLKDYVTPTNSMAVILSQLPVGDWTPVTLSLYSANWSTTRPEIYLYLQNTKEYHADFEIGPMFFNQSAGVYLGNQPMWRDWSDGASGNSYVKYPTASIPRAGCMTASFYAPKGMLNRNQRIGFFGSSQMSLDMYCDLNVGEWTMRFTTFTPSALTWTKTFTKTFDDEVCAVSVRYGANDLELFLNGESLGAWDQGEDQDYSNPSVVQTTYLGYASGGHDILPFALLGFRADEQIFTDDEIRFMHSAMTDTGALAVTVPARGRIFRLTQIPSTPRPSPTGTQWLGKLELEQVGYDPDLADITAKEILTW
jgi:hypothetical protein